MSNWSTFKAAGKRVEKLDNFDFKELADERVENIIPLKK